MFRVLRGWLRRGIQRPLGTPFAYEVSAGAVVFRRQPDGTREYLLLKYRNGHWDFVKGHVEGEETHEETVKREAWEEAQIKNLEVNTGFCRRVWYCYAPQGEERKKRLAKKAGIWIAKTVYFYVAETKEVKQVAIPKGSHEHSACIWLPYAQAIDRVTHEQSKDVLRRAERFLRT